MEERTGTCMCGGVNYTVTGEVHGIVSCHCKGCQQLHGNYNPMIVAPRENVIFNQESGLTWYDSSEGNKRGFCNVCGSALFHLAQNGTRLLISVGSLDSTEGLKNVKNVWTEEAGSYYAMPEEE